MPREVSKLRSLTEAIRRHPGKHVKVAVADIDGVLRGKYLDKEKFLGALDSGPGGGFGFCDVVFGWDVEDQCYDNGQLTGWQHGFPDAHVRIDPATFRTVPWENDRPFFLGEFVKKAEGKETPHPICPRQVLKRVLARAEAAGWTPFCGMEFEWLNFAETPQSWAAKHYVNPQPITPGMFCYSLLRPGDRRDYFQALMDELPRFGIPVEGLHTETGPGVYEAAIGFGRALETADRAVLFKSAVKEIGHRFGVMPSFLAKWNARLPGSSGHVHQSLSDGRANRFHDPKGRNGMSSLFESYLAGQLEWLLEFGPLLWPTINSYKRLVDGCWAPVRPNWGIDDRTVSFRVLTSSPKSTRLETRCPGADVNPYLAIAACIAAGMEGVERQLKLIVPPTRGAGKEAEKTPRAARTLIETTRIFQKSKIARDWLGDVFVDHFSGTREWEWRQWLDAVTDWELRRYLEII